MMRRLFHWIVITGIAALTALCLHSCTISYKLNGASIDYTTTKTISFDYIQMKTNLVFNPLEVKLNDDLQKKYAQQTRLQQVDNNGDLQISGAITGYTFASQAVKQDAYASLMRLTVKVKIKFVNKNNKSENFEKEFSAYREFEATEAINDVQEGLCNEMIEELCEEIFNATVANW